MEIGFGRLHQLAFVAEIAGVEIVAQCVPVAVEGRRHGPFHHIGIRIREEDDAVAQAAQFTDGFQVALRNAFNEAHTGIAAFFVSHFPSGIFAEFLAETLCIDPSSFQVAEKAALLERIEETVRVFHAKFFETLGRVLHVQGDDHAAQVKSDGCYLHRFFLCACKGRQKKTKKIFG